MLSLIMFLLLTPQQQTVSADSTKSMHLMIIDHLIDWGHKKSDWPRKVEAIIIHSSFNALTPDSFSLNGILDEYKEINVSPHFIIDREGGIHRLVKEEDVAYHAGKSRLPDGVTNVNQVSIGIEIINTETDGPTEGQYSSLAKLVSHLKAEYTIKFILGHSDIAPGRKTDPWLFDWNKFNSLLRGY